MVKVLFLYVVLQLSSQVFVNAVSYDCHTETERRGSSSSCSVSDSCVSEHPPSDEQQHCHDLYMYRGPKAARMPNYVQECPRLGEYYLRCNETVHHTPEDNLYFLMDSVSSELFSLDPRHFAMNVSWYYPDYGNAVSQGLRGYEVRIRSGTSFIGCWCLLNHSVFNIELGLDLSLEYNLSSPMKIEVLTLPFDGINYRDDYYLVRQSRPWPPSCHAHGVMHNYNSCFPPIYDSPQDITIHSSLVNSTKELVVSWSHPSLSHLYYVYGVSENHNFSLVVNGTQLVTVTGLNSSEKYSVTVQGYSQCSGASFGLSVISCGTISDPVNESALNHATSVFSPTSFPSTSVPFTSTITTTPPKSPLVHFLIPAMMLILLLVLVPIFILTSCVIYWHYCRHAKPITDIMADVPSGYVHLYPKPFLAEVLVLYSLKTPQAEQVLIEQTLVAFLKQHYIVNSCNDHTEKTIMQWVEEQARHAHSVLVICNKSFYEEWESPQCTPLINSLKMIIESSVALGKSNKFATVLLKHSSDQYIPNNLYLQGMRKFLINVDNKMANLDGIFAFLRNNSNI